jgi:hypothetical protein
MSGFDDHDIRTVLRAEQGKSQLPGASGDVARRFFDEQGRTAVAGDKT